MRRKLSPITLLALAAVLAASASPARAQDPVVAAAGDLVCLEPTANPSECKDAETADVVSDIAPDAVIALGDLQYENGTHSAFLNAYDKTWGRFKRITRPVPGNHEYRTAGAQGYFDYFNGVGNATGRAGSRDRGYYSFDLGQWHVVALNTTCSAIGGCGAGSPQERWLREDLAASTKPCTLAFMHHPRWSSDATHHGNTEIAPLIQALYDNRVDVALAGHAHLYERFAPQTPAGVMDSATGLTQFTVGTGGRSEYSFSSFEPNSLVRGVGYGVLRLGLHGDYYDWRFAGTPSTSISDQGAKLCHRAPRPSIRTLRFPAVADTTVRADQPAAALGSAPQLTASGSPQVRSYLKFDVTGLAGGKVTAAYLSMWVKDGSPGSGTVHRVANTAWKEPALTWSTRPALGASLGYLGRVEPGRWVAFPITSQIRGDGPISLALTSAQSDAVAYAAREGGAAYAPRLRVHVRRDDTAPTAPSGLLPTALAETSVGLAWTPSTDEVGVTGYRVYRDGRPIATTSAPSVTDTAVTGATAYRYTVVAFDAAGNESPSSAELSVTTPLNPLTRTFAPTDDTYVAAGAPTTAYGTEQTAIYDGDPLRRALLRFDVSGIADTGVERAILRVRLDNGAWKAAAVLEVPDSAWSESAVTWNTQPAALPTPVAQIPGHAAGATLDVDVTAAVRGNGPVSFLIDHADADGDGILTKESVRPDGTTRGAQLMVTGR